MNIGQPVKVKAIIEPCYVDNHRILDRIEVEPFEAMIIGQRRKMTGRVYRGWQGLEDYEPNQLVPSGSELLWEVRHGLQNVPMLVREDDLEECEAFELPIRSLKIRWEQVVTIYD